MQPLTLQPDYGYGRAAVPRGTDGVLAESGLPGGGSADRGLSLDDSIPGTKTFAKPEQDIREPDKAEEGSIYRKDDADDLAKPQNNPEEDRKQIEWLKPEYESPGGRPKDDAALTKYPNRDGRPNKHNASGPDEQAEFVAGLYRLRFAREARVIVGGMIRTAARIDDILSGLNPKTDERARHCAVQVKRVDAGNLRWIFAVNCGNGAKVVRMKAARQGNMVRVAKMDLTVSCSCDGWQWLGPEHHAEGDDYLEGSPRGTASTPAVKDPNRHNRVCKHVAAVLGHVRGWEVPLKN